jgi:hypothetical protein
VNGEMAEWSNAQSWKDCVPEMVPGVRISLSPPISVYQLFPAEVAAKTSKNC